jgi:hypothetical protein
VICVGLILTHTLRSYAADEYVINITSNDVTKGVFGYGQNCDGEMHDYWHATDGNNWTKTFPSGDYITACPKEGYVFSRWLINGAEITYDWRANQTLHRWAGGLNYDSNNEINVQAVFEALTPPDPPAPQMTADIFAPNGTLGVWEENVSIDGNQTDHITVGTTQEKTITVLVMFDNNTYRVNSANPVTTTGDVIYNDDYNNNNDNRFTLTISGDGTATVNLERITYSVTINAGEGLARVADSPNYTVQNNGTSLVTVVATTNHIDATVSVTPPSGSRVKTITASGNANYWGGQTDNPFTFRVAGDGGLITIGYGQDESDTMTIGSNNYSKGYVSAVDGWCNPNAKATSDAVYSILPTGGEGIPEIETPAYNIIACPEPGETFDHWELDGNFYSSDTTLARASRSWPITGAHELRAIFSGDDSPTNYTLPYTGSFSIWYIVGGGIGLILIPSVFLIISEGKEQKKGEKT